MLALSAAAIIEKNKLDSTGVWLLLLELYHSGSSVPVRLVRNTANVTWAGKVYQQFPFEIGDYTETGRNERPSFTLRIGNASRAMEQYLQEYAGFIGNTVKIFVVHSGNLANATPEVSLEMQVVGASSTPDWVEFQLGASAPYTMRFPQRRVMRNHCSWRFKGEECAYAGAETKCDKTLERCRELENTLRFGGFPKAGRGGDYA